VLESYIRFQVPYESPVFTRLLTGGAEEEIVREIAESCVALTPRETELHVQHEINQRLSGCRPLRAEDAGPIALVGAAGVGKTTTIAKLAAQFSLRARQRIGLLTLDTQRIAAVQQLRTFARILDLPLRVVANEDDARDALAALASCDQILVDTGGIGGRAGARVSDLGATLEALGVREVLLTLSARCAAADLRASARRLAPLAPTRVVITQIDETVRPGILLTAADLGLPISHITFGPAVPDDIREARASDLTALIMQEPARA
jgi:flagellar biosynthesis protein FlhF